MAAKAAPSALMVATRAADGGCGAGYGDPSFALQGGHRERHPTGTEDWHQHQGGTCRELRTLLRRWQAHGRDAACLHVGALAAGEDGAARRHRVRAGPSSRCSCAADGGTVAECRAVLCHASTGGCRVVIAVPKILPHDVPTRRLCRDTQLAEQLVEVPTIISGASLFLQWLMELATPVPGGGGRIAGLHGLLHGQSSTATHSSEERISERIVEQIADIPVARGDPQGLRPGQSSSSSSHVPVRVPEDADEPGQGVFRTFHKITKKCETTSALEVGTASALEPMDAGSL